MSLRSLNWLRTRNPITASDQLSTISVTFAIIYYHHNIISNNIIIHITVYVCLYCWIVDNDFIETQ